MPPAALAALAALALLLPGLAGCAGNAGVGESCARHNDCGDSLQCVRRVCTPRCERAPDCGDGYSCDDDGLCVAAHRQRGDTCASETDCAPGLSCRVRVDGPDRLARKCGDQTDGSPTGAACVADDDCRNGTCALGRCVDLCSVNRDCAAGTSCRELPHPETMYATFDGCLPTKGVVSWTLPLVATPGQPASLPEVRLPVPSDTEHASLVMSTAAPRRAGAVRLLAPGFGAVYQLCPSPLQIDCTAAQERTQHYSNALRHHREPGTSVLALRSSSALKLWPGLYRANVASFHADGSAGPPPTVTAVLRFGTATTLDLHFHFLDLADHPCQGALDGGKLDQATAQTSPSFQKDYLGALRTILKDDAALNLGAITYDDLALPHLGLDSLELRNVGALFALGKGTSGINVFFVRGLSPAGIQAYAPNPGPAMVPGAPKSGIVIGLDTLCYRQWKELARLTAHELARYMGLFPNVDVGGHLDPIIDSDETSRNLMFYSELGGGTSLSAGQREILHASPVLR